MLIKEKLENSAFPAWGMDATTRINGASH